ncbi:MAG: hypothetical protein JNK65_01010, partial [Deltaproteobacteria bacterium]|nr:hypothetical protein [Deltaproteobacteria bacterium]
MTGNILTGRNFFASTSLLERLQDESGHSELSKTQLEVDEMVSGAAGQLSDWRSMASMLVGGVGYHLGKASFLKFVGSRFIGTLAPVVGLATEVSFFEGMNEVLRKNPPQSPFFKGGEEKLSPFEKGGE